MFWHCSRACNLKKKLRNFKKIKFPNGPTSLRIQINKLNCGIHLRGFEFRYTRTRLWLSWTNCHGTGWTATWICQTPWSKEEEKKDYPPWPRDKESLSSAGKKNKENMCNQTLKREREDLGSPPHLPSYTFSSFDAIYLFIYPLDFSPPPTPSM